MNKFLLILAFFCNSALCMELVPYMDKIQCLTGSDGSQDSLEKFIIQSVIVHNPLVTVPTCRFVCKKWVGFLDTQETHNLVIRARNFNTQLLRQLGGSYSAVGYLKREIDNPLFCPTFRSRSHGNYISAILKGDKLANFFDREDVLEKILENHPLDFTEQEKEGFGDLLCVEFVDFFIVMTKAGVDFSNTDLLHKAVKKEHVNLIKNLLPLGYNVEKRDKQGMTPLTLAVLEICNTFNWHTCMDMIEFLLQAGADQNSGVGFPDQSGNYTLTVRTLFEYQSRVGLKNSEPLRVLFDHYQNARAMHNLLTGGEHCNE
jgi:ankyrin repeat protein